MRHCLVTALAAAFAAPAQAKIVATPWGVTADDGRRADLYTLTNASGMDVRITNYGGVVVSIRVPGRDGIVADVVEGFESLADYTSVDYITANGHYGAIIGRVANRIKGARVTLDGKSYTLDADKNGDLDQGGCMGYFRQVFRATTEDGPESSFILKHADPDGYMGFPSTVNVTVVYTLTENDRLHIDYHATADKPTVINLINHSYFNIAGAGPGTIEG